MSNWKFDKKATQARCLKLKRYYETHGLNADNFDCKHYDICSKFHPSGVSKQYAGGTAGLTPFYDVEYKGESIRVLVVGTESGYTRSEKYGTTANFEDRCKALIRRINEDRYGKRNNHIKGTLITLKKIFQVDTDYIYASYALSNALRCAFQYSRKHSSRTSVHVNTHMRKNCFKYMVEEIKILEPTLLITQGSWSIQPFVQRLADELGSSFKPLRTTNGREYGLYEFPDFMCITAHHPSHLGQWESTLAHISLWPAIKQLRKMHYLPTFEQNASIEYENLVKPTIDKMLELGSRIC